MIERRLTNIDIKYCAIALLAFFCRSLIAAQNSAEGLRELAAGVAFPASPTAATVNASSLPFEKGKALELLYAPPLNPGDAHAYLGAYETANGRTGLNLGYTGSVANGIWFHDGFLGAGLRLGPLGIGGTVRATTSVGTIALYEDVSMTFKRKAFRAAVAVFDAADHRDILFGFGLGKPRRINVEINALFPRAVSGRDLMANYTLTGALAFYRGIFGASVAYRYSQITDPTLGLVHGFVVGATVRVEKKLSFISQYAASPQAWSVGLVWLR